MNEVSIYIAFSAGILSFLSPCVLPLVPAYISYLTGSTVNDITKQENTVNVLFRAFCFTIGFSIIFIALGLSVTSLSQLLKSNIYLLRKIGGIVIIILGIHTTGLIKIKYLYYEKRFKINKKSNDILSSIIMGMAFATGWTPCIGPILASILIYAGSLATVKTGILLLIAYSVGLAIPFLLVAALLDYASTFLQKLYRFFPIITGLSGLLLIIMGILTYTNKIALLNNFFQILIFNYERMI